jgi:hypothetical protein
VREEGLGAGRDVRVPAVPLHTEAGAEVEDVAGGSSVLNGMHDPAPTVGVADDVRDPSRDVEPILLFELGVGLVVGDDVLDTADDVRCVAEREPFSVFVVDGDADHVASDVCGCLGQVQLDGLVVPTGAFGTGAVVTRVDGVQLGRRDVGRTLIVCTEVGAFPRLVRPAERLGDAVRADAEHHQIEIRRLSDTTRGIPADTRLEHGCVRQELRLAFLDQQTVARVGSRHNGKLLKLVWFAPLQ